MDEIAMTLWQGLMRVPCPARIPHSSPPHHVNLDADNNQPLQARGMAANSEANKAALNSMPCADWRQHRQNGGCVNRCDPAKSNPVSKVVNRRTVFSHCECKYEGENGPTSSTCCLERVEQFSKPGRKCCPTMAAPPSHWPHEYDIVQKKCVYAHCKNQWDGTKCIW